VIAATTSPVSSTHCCDRLPSLNTTWQGRPGRIFDHHATRSRAIG